MDLKANKAKTAYLILADGTVFTGKSFGCEGVMYTNAPAFTVQFHPEACGGPHDTAYLFDKFISLMEENKKCR